MNISDIIFSFFTRPPTRKKDCPLASAMYHIERMSQEAEKLLAPEEQKNQTQNL